MAGKPWKGYRCGDCKQSIPEDELVDPSSLNEHAPAVAYKVHARRLLWPVEGIIYCGPVRHYPRGSES